MLKGRKHQSIYHFISCPEMRKKQLFFVFLFCLLMNTSKAQPIIEISDAKSYSSIGTSVSILIDENANLSIHQILESGNQLKFILSTQRIPNIGITDAALWCKLKINNTTNEQCYLELFDAPPDSIAIYEMVSADSIKIITGGNYVNFKEREIQINNYVFKLCGRTDSAKIFYVRVRHSRGTQFPVSAGTLTGIVEYHHAYDLGQGIYYGVMLLMVLYNLFIYFSIRDKSYIYYVFYGACMILMNASLNGYAFEYFWPGHATINKYVDIITSTLGISGILFIMNFLQTKKNYPKMHRVFIGFMGIFAICMILVLTSQYRLATLLAEITSIALMICFFISAIYLFQKGYQPAKFFLYAWSCLLLCVCIFILKDFDIIPYNTFTANSLQIGSAIEALLLSFALADKINISKKEKWKLLEQHREDMLKNQLEIKQQTMHFIGREIHDNIGQKLTLAALYSQRMEFGNLSEDTLEQVKGVSKIINDSLEELRGLSRNLAESRLEHNNLTELLQLECDRINATNICKAVLDADEQIPEMNIMVKHFLLRIVQEFIQNSLKHSGCTLISVMLKKGIDGYTITVTDNGKGFDINAIEGHGIGLSNMQRRMQVIGGEFNLKSQPGEGSILILFIPFELLNQSIN